MAAWAKPGVKCVCIFGAFYPVYGETVPVEGRTYTIRDVQWHDDVKRTGIRLVEIVNGPMPYTNGVKEACFDVEQFRPLIATSKSVEDDVALFDHHLIIQKEKINEPA